MNPRFILSFSLAALIAVTAPAVSHFAVSYGDDDPLNPADVQDFAAKDTNRIRGNITRALVKKCAYLDVLDGGTLEAGLSDTVRSIVQERAVLNQSLVRPEFRPDTEMCGKTGEAAEVGSTEYSYFLGTNRGMGPLVCIKGMRNAFEGSYSAAEDALRKQLLHLKNADIRSQLLDRSGTKLVVKSGVTFEEMFTGDSQAIDTEFTSDFLPDGPINWKLLEYLGIFQKENLLVEGFDGPAGDQLLRFIGSQEIITKLRDDAGIRDDARYIASGSYKWGEQTLTRYSWEGPYRGWSFAVDPQPLRFSEVDEDGQPVLLEPEIAVETDKGFAARVNPQWARARFEIAIAMGMNSFKMLTPASYNGEAGFKFPPQAHMGELKFKVLEDNGDNVWGDFGRHFYQFSRAYQPIRPHAVCAIAYKRKPADFEVEAVSDYPDYSSEDSL